MVSTCLNLPLHVVSINIKHLLAVDPTLKPALVGLFRDDEEHGLDTVDADVQISTYGLSLGSIDTQTS